jgi:F-type H+-transporting ATPase subunit epsilon
MADKQSLALEIITPDGVAFEGSVEELTASGTQGVFGVLPGHRPLMAALRTGLLTCVQENTQRQFAIGAGFAEVSIRRVVILTDRFITKEAVDPVQVRLDLKDAAEALENFSGEVGSAEHGEIVSKQLWAAAQLELYGDPPPATFCVFAEVEAAPRESYARAADESLATSDTQHTKGP